MFQGIRYVAVAVNNLEEAIERFGRLYGLQPMREPTLGRWGFNTVMLAAGDQRMIELMSPPPDSDSALARLMKERAIPSNPYGEGVYLISVTVEDIEKSIKQIEDDYNKLWNNYSYYQVEQSVNRSVRFFARNLRRKL